MSTLESMRVARVARIETEARAAHAPPSRASFGVVFLAIAVLGVSLGLATNMLAGAAITALFATTFTLKRMRTEVRELDGDQRPS